MRLVLDFLSEFFSNYALFFAETLTIVVAIIVVIGVIANANQKNKQTAEGHIKVTHRSDELKVLKNNLYKEVMPKEAYKIYEKEQKQQEKDKAKAQTKKLKQQSSKSNHSDDKSADEKVSSKVDDETSRLFVLNFNGDVEASSVANLREEVTALLSIAKENDEVLVCLESPGGMVHSYGLAASQLKRIKSKPLKLTIAVDKVAASGGYMMACVADRIIAAPFAVIGSIGVIGQLPNFHRLLKHNKVDYEQFTAGEFKRTLTMFGENTEKSREKFQEELEETHVLFKDYIRDNRPALDIDKVATGEHWYGTKALELGLIDDIKTSDEEIMVWAQEHEVFEIAYEIKKTLTDRLSLSFRTQFEKAIANFWNKAETMRLFK